MKHYETSWKGIYGQKQYAQGWEPQSQKPRAVLLIVHGLGEHSGRYADLAAFFCQRGWAVLALDRCGHGKSEGKRGHIPRYEMLLDEVIKLKTEATRLYSKLPICLYGHSMGGNIVLNYLLRKGAASLKACVATAPALKLAFEPSAFLLSLGRIMRKIYPAFTQNNELDVQKLSRDPAIVQAYLADPLVHSKVSSETALGLLEWGRWAMQQAAQKKHSPCPLLLVHGQADAITDAQASAQFAQDLQGDVTAKIWPELYHEIHNEPEKQAVLEYIATWLETKLKP